MVDTFIDFLKENPDLKEELELFSEVSAVPENEVFGKKENLYKERYDLENEFNQAAVARLEGDISQQEKADFELYLDSHPKKKEEAELFGKTKLVADESIRFEKKKRLYKQNNRKMILLWSGRVAAVLVLTIAIFSLLDTQNSGSSLQQPIAEVLKKTTVEKNTLPSASIAPKNDGPEKEKSEKGTVEKETEQVKTEPTEKPVPVRSVAREKIADAQKNVEEIVPREAMKIPASMQALTASIDAPAPRPRLSRMQLASPEPIPEEDEWLIADNIREKINLKNLGKAGLSFVSNLSKDRFTYETDDSGKITEVNYDSRLLGFSIPTASAQPQ